MKTVFVSGTAGSGKSTFSARLYEHYAKSGAFAAVANLDPGTESLAYECEIDVRDYVDHAAIMRQYGLGPNGAMVMANDLIASKIDEIRNDIGRANPDYLIVDTPGQIELFAYRSSGPFITENITSEEKASIFLFDGALINTPVNFVSVALLATSVRLRLGLAAVNALTKTDLIGGRLREILLWSGNLGALEGAIAGGTDGETYSLTSAILRGLNLGGFAQGLMPVSNVTGDGMANIGAALGRILDLGEEAEG